MDYKIRGTFTKCRGFIYRTETFIQFGDSKEIIGSCVLCNPGSSRLEDTEDQRRLEAYNGNDDYVVDGELKSDPAMKQLVKILTGTETIEKNGRFLIFNLFTLKNPKMKAAIMEFSHLDINKVLLYKDYEDFKRSQVNLPWILIGWGCDDNPTLKEIKLEWSKYINDNKVIKDGKEHIQSPHYYHPLPPIFSKQIEYVDYIIPKLNNLSAKALI